MTENDDPADKSGVIRLVAIMSTILFILGVMPFSVLSKEVQRCVSLENGVHLGADVMSDWYRFYLLTVATPNLPTGTLLFERPASSALITENTIHTDTMDLLDDTAFNAAVRDDVNAVGKVSATRARYAALVATEGQGNAAVGISAGTSGKDVTIRDFVRHPAHMDYWCRLDRFGQASNAYLL